MVTPRQLLFLPGELAAEDLERAKLITQARHTILSQHPELSDRNTVYSAHEIATDLRQMRTVERSRLRDILLADKGQILPNSKGKTLLKIYPLRISAQPTNTNQQDSSQGSFSRIRAAYAEHPEDPERLIKVAVKQVRNAHDTTAQRIFEREKIIARSIMPLQDDETEGRQPLVKVLAVGDKAIIYEWCEDEDGQATTLKTARLQPFEYLNCVADAAQALAWLHNKGIKYLDLSPDNLMLAREKKAKLGDFGSARFYEEVVDYDTVFNRQYYDPNLIIQQEYKRDALDIADKHALGVMLRTFLLKYKFGNISTLDNGRRKLVLLPEFSILQPILSLSHELRASLFHPYPFYGKDSDDADLEYHSLQEATILLKRLGRFVKDRITSAISITETSITPYDPRTE